jgi:hypothetical protein
MNTVLSTQRQYAEKRLANLRDECSSLLPLLDDEPLCVYVTGSYGRLEAWEQSDLDVFFLDPRTQDAEFDPRTQEASQFPFLTLVRLCAGLADAADKLDFPPFTGNGKYLEVQYIEEMERSLGSPRDDEINAFTARMLLLLESRSLLNDALYAKLVQQVIGFYFRDYPDHPDEFIPVFLTNDILRFWRTLTLNYEHDRYEISLLKRNEQSRAKANSALKNYKLKFSRLTTCFSMIANLVAIGPPVTPDHVLALTQITPMDRFRELRGRGNASDTIIDEIEGSYATFLKQVQRPKDELLADLAPRETRRKLLAEANSYGEMIYRLLRAVATEDRIRHLIV